MNSIRQKFIVLLLLAGLVPTFVVSAVAFVTISNELNKRTAAQLASLDIKQQQTINSLLQNKQEEVIKLSNAYEFQTALEQYMNSGGQTGYGAITAILHAKLAEVPSMVVINVADLNNKIIASTQPAREGRALQQQAGFTATNEGPVVTIMQDQTDGLDELYISTNLSINKQDSAVLRVIFRIDDLVAALADYTGLGASGETVVTKPSTGRNLSMLPLRFNSATSLAPYKSTDQGSGINYRGHSVLYSSRPVGFSDWTISTMIDRSEALAPIAQLRDSLLIIFVLSSAIITLIALYLAKVITGPILRITTASLRIGKGDFDARVELHRRDEIGELAASINAMGASLKAFVSGIESQRNHLQVILNSTNDSILALDKQGLITTANLAAAELTGRDVRDIVGKPWYEIFQLTSDLQPVAINFDAPGTQAYGNIQFVNAGGATRYLKLVVARLDGRGTGEQNIVTIRDETKNRELENMKVDFVSMAAHELRTPLAAIKGYIELVSLKLKGAPPEIANYLNQTLKSAMELSGLINNLLDVSRIERGTLTLDMGKVDLAASMWRAVQDATFAAKDKKVKLHYRGPHTGLWVEADEVALREVIANLLTNAVNYTPSGGNVSASLDAEGETYRVAIQDTGEGIPAAALPHLFTKFFRVHGGLDSGSTGTGLGLFIAKSIIERHQGTIRAESEEGMGSTFTFTIPVLTPERLATIQAREQAKGETTKRHRGWTTKNTPR